MRILLADKLSDQGLAQLSAAGLTVIYEPALSEKALTSALREHAPHVLVVRSTKVLKADISASNKLELIVRAGAGYDTIDLEAASAAGVFVANCPGKNAVAVAELTIGGLLSLDRSLPDNVMDARQGVWNKGLYAKASGLKGRTLGVVGLGNIGLEVIKRAKALEMHIVAWSRSLTDDRARELGILRVGSPIDVAARADAVTLHVAATPDTHKLANEAFFGAMKPGAFFINTTRASVVDEEALTDAIRNKGIRAFLDVLSNEPSSKEGPLQHPLAENPSIYLSHHIGASTAEAQDAVASEAARVILEYAARGEVPNCVNLAVQSPATHQLTVRHEDRVGVLVTVLDAIRKAGWNIQEMENVIFDGAKAACAYIRFDGDVDSAVVEEISQLDHILAVSLIEI
ncbi:MAG: hydroxyacid dehydrogenase [Bacteroidetes bacterium CG12_big_fil_rev_8_21_14_0_65_60_17]|nr:MAG: hydroxyacid dehydrogenase [Bacteroidetes bacterium CG12_big_fil_rev_8_21_14_0_65_60_17]